VPPLDSDLRGWFSQHKGVVILALAALLLIFYFLFPFLDGLILGTVFAYVGRPIRDKFRQRRRLGSLVASVCIVVPIFFILGLGMLEIANQVISLAQNQEAFRTALGFSLAKLALDIPPGAQELIAGSLQNIAEVLAPIIAGMPVFAIGRTVSLGIINFIISIPVCYFVLLDGEAFVDSVMAVMPPGEVEVYRKYIARIDRILSGIYIGTIYTSILGSFIAAVVFYAFDLPRPFALASFVFVAGMVPILTAWMVILPLALYRYIVLGFDQAAIFFLVASALIYLPSELLIRPYLVATKSSLHPLLVMLSFFGGALVAGIGGFFLAPAIMGALVGIYQVRREEMAKERAGEELELS
jgi:predicted PurR-regulated permease PerM